MRKRISRRLGRLPAFALTGAFAFTLCAVAVIHVESQARRRRHAENEQCVESLLNSVDGGHSSRRLAVAVFCIDEPTGRSYAALERILRSEANLDWSYVGAKKVQDGVLHNFDVVIFPGGRAPLQAKALGDSGKQAVKAFINDGGGYLGICAGAFLATAEYDWSLKVINAKTMCGEVYVPRIGIVQRSTRNGASVTIEHTEWGKRVFGGGDTHLEVRYAGGPIFSPFDHPDLPAYVCLSKYGSDTWTFEFQKGTMINTPAIITARYGKGHVMAISPHVEVRANSEHIVRRAIRVLSQRVFHQTAIDQHSQPIQDARAAQLGQEQVMDLLPNADRSIRRSVAREFVVPVRYRRNLESSRGFPAACGGDRDASGPAAQTLLRRANCKSSGARPTNPR